MRAVGFIGLGHMGLPMALNLLKAGYTVTGFDLQQEPLEQLAGAGGRIASSLLQVAQDHEVLITMLQNGQQVQDVCLADKGVYSVLPVGALHIDCSSIDVVSSRIVHEQALNRKIQAVDAPVSGGVAGAHHANLTFMVGGNEQGFAQAKPILSAMGKKIIHVGSSGNGQTAKICNNMILGITMIAVSEAFLLAKQHGLPAEKLFDVVNNSSGQCWVMSKYPPVSGLLPDVPADKNYEPGFTGRMMLKDLTLSQEAAKQAGITTPLGEHAQKLYEQLIESGQGDLDFSVIIKMLTERTDV